MKTVIYILLCCGFLIGCNTSKTIASQDTPGAANAVASDTVRIANEELQYEIIIIDPGFESWLYGRAKPKGYYSQSFLESRNRLFVTEWNLRVLQGLRFDPLLYEMQIDYQYHIDYGYEVNYKLYYYFIYFQLENNQRLSGFIPRI
jgi:hypothetical protein